MSASATAQPQTSSGWTCTTAQACASSRAGARTAGAMPEGGSGSFGDFLGNIIDVVNPLQHIPVVSSIYRSLTGDQIGGAARIAGGALYGGPIGGAMAVADVALAQEKGAYVADTMIAGLMGGAAVAAAPVMLAHNSAAEVAAIAPAAGDTAPTVSLKTSNSSSLSASPTPNRTRTANSELVTSRAPDTPVSRHAGAEFIPATVRFTGGADATQRLTALSSADASSSLPEAPADPRMGLPPELMALKMQEALDKYAAMKAHGI